MIFVVDKVPPSTLSRILWLEEANDSFSKVFDVEVVGVVTKGGLRKGSGVGEICGSDLPRGERRGDWELRRRVLGANEDGVGAAVRGGSLVATNRLAVLRYEWKLQAKGFVETKGALTGNSLIFKAQFLGSRSARAIRKMVVVGVARLGGTGHRSMVAGRA